VLTRTKLKTEDRQAELVQAALNLAAIKSPAEITTGDLAQAIGITQGGVFKHFESKEAIWLAVLAWAHQTLIGRLQQVAQAQQTSALQALRAVFTAHIGFVHTYPGVPRLIFQELQHAKPTALKGKVQLLMADYRGLVAELLAQAHEEGLIKAEVDPKGAVVLFMGAVQGLVMQSLVTGSLKDMARHAQAVFNIYEAGLLMPSAAESRKCK
jgi:AcrR family transcriptional regulator